MPLIRIDDREIEAAAGETLLRVALNEGIYIPYYCWHPALSIVGQCRMCLVAVQGAPKLLPACATRVMEAPPDRKIDGKYDMVVETKSDTVKKAQRGILEFLLLNHPLDCPICDQAGECQLQNYSYQYGSPTSRQEFERKPAPKRVDIGPHIVYDGERCIKCTRCIRFCREITGTDELTLVYRGVKTYVEPFPGTKLDNPYSGCTVDTCPVGALTSKEFRFKERVWFLTSANSICPECSRGCSVRYDSHKGEILRLVPRDNPQVNGPWMCDHGRLLSERIKGLDRLDRPAFRRGESLEKHTWEEFAPRLVEKMSFHRQNLKKTLAVILSGRMNLEEMAAYRHLSASLLGGISGTALMVTEGEDDDLLIRKEKRPNLEGARRLKIPLSDENPAVSGLLKGKKVALIVREDIVGDAEGDEKAALVKALEGMDLVIVADDRTTETMKYAHVVIPLTAWHEMEGTTLNFQGVVQKTAKVTTAPRDRRPFYEVVALWMKAEERDAPGPAFVPWFTLVKEKVDGMWGVMIRDLLPHGVALGEPAETEESGEESS